MTGIDRFDDKLKRKMRRKYRETHEGSLRRRKNNKKNYNYELDDDDPRG